MKKVAVAILALLYLTASSGIAMTIHYCMGKVSSVDLYSNSERCGKCGMKKANGCCEDKFKIIKLDDTHKLISRGINIFAPSAIVNNPKHFFNSDLHYTAFHSVLNNHSPPESPGLSLCILNSVFRI
jgi:hypothetical protein